jgi:hypothetical protein
VLGTLKFFERAVIAMLIFDGSHDQGVNLLGAGRGICSDGCCELTARLRSRGRSARARCKCSSADSNHTEMFSEIHFHLAPPSEA